MSLCSVTHLLPDPTDVGGSALRHWLRGPNPLVDGIPSLLTTEALDGGDPRAHELEADLAKAQELVGLIERGVFHVIEKLDFPERTDVLGTRFIMAI